VEPLVDDALLFEDALPLLVDEVVPLEDVPLEDDAPPLDEVVPLDDAPLLDEDVVEVSPEELLLPVLPPLPPFPSPPAHAPRATAPAQTRNL
jgi:hypothetical protein